MTPTRPVSHASIESVWGQAVHDYTFVPSGCDVYSPTTRSIGTSAMHINMDTVTADPGGFLDAANDQIVIPTGRTGLYVGVCICTTINGSAGSGFSTRAIVNVNGTNIASNIEDNQGGTAATIIVPIFWPFNAGDIIQIFAQRRGAGTNPDVTVSRFAMVRIADDFGA